MFESADAFESGQHRLEGIEQLIAEPGRVTDLERTALLAEMDGIWEQMEELARTCHHASDSVCAILARLLSADSIERMVTLGTNPPIVIALRKRRFRAFQRYWSVFRSQFLKDSGRAVRLCAQNREWPAFGREQRRRVKVEVLLLLLYRSAILYRYGVRVQVGSLCYRLQVLVSDLPSCCGEGSA